MAYQAELDVRDICIRVFEVSYEYPEDNYIVIDSLDQSLVGKWYNRETQQFETATFDKLAYHSTDEINVGETDQVLTDALNGKMGKTAIANPITSNADDTVTKWVELGTGIYYFNKAGVLTDQPSQYGFLINFASGANVFQLWKTQPNAGFCTRGGNANGWSGTWKALVTSDALDAYLLKTGGTLTSYFTCSGDPLAVRADNTGWMRLFGGTNINNGGRFQVAGKDCEGYEGEAWMVANDGTNQHSLRVKPNGEAYFTGNLFKLNGQQALYNSGTMMNVGTGNLPLNLVGKDAIYSQHSLQVTSDLRMKENFKPVNPQQAVNFIQNLNVTEFNYKGSTDKKIGLIAQQVQLADPEFSERFVKTNPADGMLSVNYTDLINPLIVTVQALMNEVVTLREMVQQAK